jgi:hypothetical protein
MRNVTPRIYLLICSSCSLLPFFPLHGQRVRIRKMYSYMLSRREHVRMRLAACKDPSLSQLLRRSRKKTPCTRAHAMRTQSSACNDEPSAMDHMHACMHICGYAIDLRPSSSSNLVNNVHACTYMHVHMQHVRFDTPIQMKFKIKSTQMNLCFETEYCKSYLRLKV